jgi:hypothetical protein
MKRRAPTAATIPNAAGWWLTAALVAAGAAVVPADFVLPFLPVDLGPAVTPVFLVVVVSGLLPVEVLLPAIGPAVEPEACGDVTDVKKLE